MKTLILTDIMKTGHHWWYADFLRYHTIMDQIIDVCDDYYKLHQHNLESYDKKIAVICGMNDFLLDNEEYKNDLNCKIEKLKSQGFKFILGIPWESRGNTRHNQHIKIYRKICFDTWHGDHDWFWYYMYSKNKDKNFIFDHTVKLYDFLYLNKIKRQHRVNLFNKIVSKNILSNSLFSFTDMQPPYRLPKEYELPWLRGESYPSTHGNEDQDIFEKPYNVSSINIVSETNNNNEETFITEKSWKPIIAGQIFVIHGNYRTLAKLKELGFQTFDCIFDESYDNELDPNKRIKKIVELLTKLKSSKFLDLYANTKIIRDHNQKLFWNKQKLSEIINQRVLSFLKLVDRS